MDEYTLDHKRFQVLEYDIDVKDALLAEAIQMLSDRKRDVVLLAYFMGMSDAEIARQLNLVRSTVGEHRKRALELMKKKMEELQNEKEEQRK